MEERRGVTVTYPKMMPRQHIGSGSSWRYRCKRRRADVRNKLEIVGCSRLPGSHGLVAWKRVTIRTRCKRCISFNTCIRSRAASRRYTFEACVFGAVRVVEGSSRSRAVVEVDVHGSSWEVVVHDVVEVVVHVATVVVHVFVDVQVDGSGTRDVGVLVGPVFAV